MLFSGQEDSARASACRGCIVVLQSLMPFRDQENPAHASARRGCIAVLGSFRDQKDLGRVSAYGGVLQSKDHSGHRKTQRMQVRVVVVLQSKDLSEARPRKTQHMQVRTEVVLQSLGPFRDKKKT